MKRDPKYSYRHQLRRKEFAPKVAVGKIVCRRCGRVIEGWEPWDLGHADFDPSLPTYPEHRRCNRATSGRLQRRARRGINRHSRKW